MKCHEGFTAVRVDLESRAELDLILHALELGALVCREKRPTPDLFTSEAMERARCAIAEAAGL